MSEANSTISYRDVPGFPGYRAGSDGSIWSCQTRRNRLGTKWHKLSLTDMGRGYLEVTLCRDGKKFQRRVHRIILEAFVGPCPPGMECRHFPDRNRGNNSIANLQWSTRKINHADKIAHGTVIRGISHHKTTLTGDQVSDMRAEYASGSISLPQLAKRYGVAISTTHRIITRKVWKHV